MCYNEATRVKEPRGGRHNSVDPQQAREYRARWQAVAAIEEEEQRASSVQSRWQQLNAILRLAAGLGLNMAQPDEEEAVRARWARLKAK